MVVTDVYQEFIIRTRRTGMADVFVSRRYGDFNRLAEEVNPSVKIEYRH